MAYPHVGRVSLGARAGHRPVLITTVQNRTEQENIGTSYWYYCLPT